MQCLETNKHRSGVTHECRTTIRMRMLKEHSNYQLNIGLKKVLKLLVLDRNDSISQFNLTIPIIAMSYTLFSGLQS